MIDSGCSTSISVAVAYSFPDPELSVDLSRPSFECLEGEAKDSIMRYSAFYFAMLQPNSFPKGTPRFRSGKGPPCSAMRLLSAWRFLHNLAATAIGNLP